MSYFGFLARFLLIPIFLFALLNYWEWRRSKGLPPSLQASSPWKLLAVLVVVALVYTTPWDNYLVATGVWWYDPAQVTGIILGWVPLEEYLFFILQPILVGLWLFWLARRLPEVPASNDNGMHIRVGSTVLVCLVWIAAIMILVTKWQPGIYLALTLAWALPPIMLQLFFGMDILLRHWRLTLLTSIPIALYLSFADTLAISAGIWTIDPEQSLGLLLGGRLPIEESIFFTLTTILVTFGLVLGLAAESRRRIGDAHKRSNAFTSASPPKSLRHPWQNGCAHLHRYAKSCVPPKRREPLGWDAHSYSQPPPE
jgi:lycopene cyclase domain-containing protein